MSSGSCLGWRKFESFINRYAREVLFFTFPKLFRFTGKFISLKLSNNERFSSHYWFALFELISVSVALKKSFFFPFFFFRLMTQKIFCLNYLTTLFSTQMSNMLNARTFIDSRSDGRKMSLRHTVEDVCSRL